MSLVDNIKIIEDGYKLIMKDKTEIISQYDKKGELDMMFKNDSPDMIASSKK